MAECDIPGCEEADGMTIDGYCRLHRVVADYSFGKLANAASELAEHERDE